VQLCPSLDGVLAAPDGLSIIVCVHFGTFEAVRSWPQPAHPRTVRIWRDGLALEECIFDGGLHAQAFRSEGNIGSPTDRASNGIDPREDPAFIDVCAKDPSSSQFCSVKALFPILAFIARELAGRPCSTINLCTLNLALGMGSKAMRRASRSWGWLVERYDADAASGPVASNRSYLRGSIDTNERCATESAPRSLVSSAIFCASISSPATRSLVGNGRSSAVTGNTETAVSMAANPGKAPDVQKTALAAGDI